MLTPAQKAMYFAVVENARNPKGTRFAVNRRHNGTKTAAVLIRKQFVKDVTQPNDTAQYLALVR